jgi:hypothetical protein
MKSLITEIDHRTSMIRGVSRSIPHFAAKKDEEQEKILIVKTEQIDNLAKEIVELVNVRQLQPSYYLLGDVVSFYEQDEHDLLASRIFKDNIDIDLVFHVPGMHHPSDLVEAVSGWNNWVEITESDYHWIQSIIHIRETQQ